MKRILITILVVICSLYVLMIVLINLARVVVYKSKADPIEQAVSQALGNKDLVLGSKLKLWFESLGEPDLKANCETLFKYTELYWLNSGIGVEVDGEINGELSSASNERVIAIIVPTKKAPPLV